jgi:integrase
MALTISQIRTLAPGRHNDGKGLLLEIKPSGAKHSILRYQKFGREHWMGLGSFPDVTLAAAREAAIDARRLLRDGRDPIGSRRATLAAARGSDRTFAEIALETHETMASGWSNRKHRMDWISSLRRHVFPKIGKLPIAAVGTAEVVEVLRPIWGKRSARKILERIKAVLDRASALGLRTGDNPARWSGHLEHLLPAKNGTTEHHAALPWRSMPSFMAKLRALDALDARALEFMILTATRTGETRLATWSEIDLENAVWTIPPERAKTRKQFRVPLSPRAVQILKELPREANWLFPGAKPGKPIGENSFLRVLENIGYPDITGHGFRSTFRDWAGESTATAPDVIELSLAHTVGSGVERAYARSDLFDKRRRLMSMWNEFCSFAHEQTALIKNIRRP